MTTLRFDVPDIHCDHCKSSIEGAVPGATVDVDSKTVTVVADQPSAEEITSRLEDLGYEVAHVHTG